MARTAAADTHDRPAIDALSNGGVQLHHTRLSRVVVPEFVLRQASHATGPTGMDRPDPVPAPSRA